MARKAPARPVAVLGACVLIPGGLRDLLLSCAHAKLFRPLWQDEILDEVRRNSVRLLVERRGLTGAAAEKSVGRTLGQMANAFPDACADSDLWVPLVADMECHTKDRHLLAVAVGTEATHLVTDNVVDFPAASIPIGLELVKPDPFMCARLAIEPGRVVEAVEGMATRLKRPKQTATQLAAAMTQGQFVPTFGAQLLDLSCARPAHSWSSRPGSPARCHASADRCIHSQRAVLPEARLREGKAKHVPGQLPTGADGTVDRDTGSLQPCETTVPSRRCTVQPRGSRRGGPRRV